MRLEIPWSAIGRVLLAAGLVWCWFQLTTFVLVAVIAILLAVTLEPVVRWLERHRVPRWAGSALVVLSLASAIVLFVYMTSASLGDQLGTLGGKMAAVEKTLLARLPQSWIDILSPHNASDSVQSYIASGGMRLAQSAARALAFFALATILTLYLLIEGELTYAWMLAFVPLAQRQKVAQTAVECQRVVSAYVAGNILTSLFAGLFVFVAMSLLKVPAALLLALLAGVCDFIPVLGFAFSSIPAIVLATSVSSTTALLVVGLYVAYHTIENYLIAPLVYGDRLRLSNVAVVVAFAIGAELAGVVGALLALPIAAAYPSIERIWLRRSLPETTVEEHAAIDGHERDAGEGEGDGDGIDAPGPRAHIAMPQAVSRARRGRRTRPA